MTDQVIACLPMYDWPEVRGALDELWSGFVAGLSDWAGSRPATLDRSDDLDRLWRHPQLLVGQTCGIPYVESLHTMVGVLGSFAFDIDCAPGDYYSEIMCRADDPAAGVGELRNRRVAINAADSQSGHQSLLSTVAALGPPGGRFFAESVVTGSHRESIRAVVEGRADVAAIDTVSYRLARDHEPAVESLRILGRTVATPGTPVISSLRFAADHRRLADAMTLAVHRLSPEARAALYLRGFRRRPGSDYQIQRVRWDEAARLGYSSLLDAS